jgi:hypothetical protein
MRVQMIDMGVTALPPVFPADAVWSLTPWLLTAMSVGLGLLAFIFATVILSRTKDFTPLLLCLGGALAALVAEPLLGHLDLLAWGQGYPGPTFSAFGANIPFFVPPVYAFYLGMSGYLGSRLFQRGLTIRGVWTFWAILIATDMMFQLIAVNLKAYVYFGSQPISILHLPLMGSFKNATAYLLIGLLVWALAPRLTGASRALLVLVPITGYLGGALITAWPWYIAINSDMTGPTATVVAALTFVLCGLAVQGVALTVGTDSPWRDSPDPHVRDAHAKPATAER